MEATDLFLATMDDLDRYLKVGDDYSMLRASALLRQLLMDGSPLVHQVNRKFKHDLQFKVCGRQYSERVLRMGPVFYSALGGIHHSGSKSHEHEHVSLKEFLATNVLKLGHLVLTIRDLISISANVLGGVHKGVAKAEREQAVVRFNGIVFVSGNSVSAAQMKPIVLVAFEGLQPLVNLVRNDR